VLRLVHGALILLATMTAIRQHRIGVRGPVEHVLLHHAGEGIGGRCPWLGHITLSRVWPVA
jgi:hypothetical protein